jgi:SAM-dependent methyltransferase
MPLAGAFLRPGADKQEHLYPMTVCFCPRCTLVQIPEVIPKETLFNDEYHYFSSVTSTLNDHFDGYADYLVSRLAPQDDRLILECGCNDGVLLAKLRRRGLNAVGVDASGNVVKAARNRGLDVLHSFFGPKFARAYLSAGRQQPHIITGSNVFAHNDDVGSMLDAVNLLLAPGGQLCVEVHYLPDLLAGRQFDFFYHEHCNYYSLRSLSELLRRHALCVVDAERIPLHGGSIRISARRAEDAVSPSPAIASVLDDEQSRGLGELHTYLDFSATIARFRDEAVRLFNQLHRLGKRVCGYGASGRAVTLLNYIGPAAGCIEFMLDGSPARANTLLPGLQLPIHEARPEQLAEADVCVITAWPYADEIIRKEQWFLEAGRTVVVPLPEMRVVTV